VSSFLSAKDPAPPSGYPKAYLNWILLDDQFNYVSSASGSIAVASTTYPANQFNTIAAGGPIVMPRNGYLYVWVSNETQGWDVFFDNFTVQYKQGPVLEENHYYPFGLTMAGISDKAIKTNYAENKYRFQKQELQNKEFSDGSGLEMYEFKYRFDDCQIGRFWSIDPLADKYVYNSPYAFSENHVTSHIELEGLEKFPINEDNPSSGDPNSSTARSAKNQQAVESQRAAGRAVAEATTVTSNSSNSNNSTAANSTTLKQTGGEGGESKPLVGSTNTDKITKEVNLVPGTLGDKVAVSSYSGGVVGKEGSAVTTDASTNNGKPEGGSITLGGILTLGVSRDGSVSAGLGAGGYEGHVSVGFGVGLGQVGTGGSHTENGATSGGDVTIRPGGGAAIVAAIVLLSPILAF
jgi:RHS repeat-associated protein